MMNNNRHLKLLERYKRNQLSNDELVELFDWINSMEGVEEFDKYLTQQLQSAESGISAYPDVEYEKIYRKIKEKNGIGTVRTFHLGAWKKYAAVFLLLILSGTLFILMRPSSGEDETIFAVSKGNKGNLFLPDGSEIQLNAESKIYYAATNKRKIKLEGEACLHVAKDKKRRFVVNTSFGDIIVYGTTFNVAAYPQDSMMYVSLMEGSVGIQLAGQKQIVRIVPGETVSYNARSGKMERYTQSMDNVALWRNEHLQMVDVNVSTLCSRLEAWYGVKIILKNEYAGKRKYNMTLRNETLEEALELLNGITPIIYKIQRKEVSIYFNR